MILRSTARDIENNLTNEKNASIGTQVNNSTSTSTNGHINSDKNVDNNRLIMNSDSNDINTYTNKSPLPGVSTELEKMNKMDASRGLPDVCTFSTLSVPPLSSSPKVSVFKSGNLESDSGAVPVPLRISLVNEVSKASRHYLFFYLFSLEVGISCNFYKKNMIQ